MLGSAYKQKYIYPGGWDEEIQRQSKDILTWDMYNEKWEKYGEMLEPRHRHTNVVFDYGGFIFIH